LQLVDKHDQCLRLFETQLELITSKKAAPKGKAA
jgi:hypothetical protein